MLKKLRWKFVFMATGISFLVLIMISISVLAITNRYIIDKADTLLSVLVDNEYELNENYSQEQDMFAREVAFSTRFFVVYTDELGNIIDSNTKQINAVDQALMQEYVAAVDATSEQGLIDDYRYLIIENEQGYTYVFLDVEEDMQVSDIFVHYTFIIAFGALLAIFLLSFFVSKRVVKPIMQSIESQKRFITDASHELKTPLTIIKADTDIIEMDHGEGEWTHSIKEEITKMDSLIKSLIELSSFDENGSELVKTDFSLSDALGETVKSFMPSMKQKGVVLNAAIMPGISYVGNEDSIRKLLAILIDNSIYYALDGSEININLNKARKIFTIENECNGIEIGSYNQWFERFYREDASRNSAKKGFGIGLSIAKNICERHNIKISAKSNNGKTIVMKLDF